MLIVNNQIMGGVAMWLCGGGVVTLVSSAGTGGGTVAYSAPSYVWTNNSGSTGLFSFTWFQTRDAV